MAKRLTDTELWDQDWFIDLPNKYKLCFFFIKDKCDNAGIWRPNKSLIQRIINEPVTLEEFLSFVNIGKQRIIVLPSGRWFLIDFFIFQYGDKFSPTSKVHKGALKQLLANGVHPKELVKLDAGKLNDIGFQELKEIAYGKDMERLSIAYGKPINRVKDKNKDKAKDKDSLEGGSGEGEVVVLEPLGIELVSKIANEVWSNQKWVEATCIGQRLQKSDLQRWMAQYNSSICNDHLEAFDKSKYQKMFGGWLNTQIAKGYTLSNPPPNNNNGTPPLKKIN